MQLIDPTHKIYQPLWARLLIVSICTVWFVVEATVGDSFWMMITGALAVYTAWVLLFRFKPVVQTEHPAVTDATNTQNLGSPGQE